MQRVASATARLRAAEKQVAACHRDRADAIRALIARCKGNQSQAAHLIGLDQSTVNKLLKRFPPRIGEQENDWLLSYGDELFPDDWSLRSDHGVLLHTDAFGLDESEQAQDGAREIVCEHGASVEEGDPRPPVPGHGKRWCAR